MKKKPKPVECQACGDTGIMAHAINPDGTSKRIRCTHCAKGKRRGPKAR